MRILPTANVWVIFPQTTSSATLQTAVGDPAVQFISDTDNLELAQPPQFKDSVPKMPPFQTPMVCLGLVIC